MVALTSETPRSTPLTRVAVIGDVHAEDVRLAVALDAIAGVDVDEVLCTGDVVTGRGSIEACCRILRDRGVRCVRGNHDRWFLNGINGQPPGAAAAPSSVREFVASFPPVRDIAVAGGGLALQCHGIGRHDLEKITEFHTAHSLSKNHALQEILGAGKYRWMINGHSHERGVRRIDDLIIVNAGALCEPGHAGFAVVDFAAGSVRWHAVDDDRVTFVDECSVPPRLRQ